MAGPLTPGVHVEGIGPYSPQIRPAPTGITAFIGRATRGPTNEPALVQSFQEFEAKFGGLRAECPMTYALHGFFENGGRQALVIRLHRAGQPRRGSDSSIKRPEKASTPGLPLDARTLIGSREERTGLYALEKADLFNLLCIPPDVPEGDTHPAVYQEALRYCVERRAMLIIDPPAAWSAGMDAAGAASAATRGIAALGLTGPETRNAVFYFPRLVISDPLAPGRALTLAPSGHVAGVIARTDAARGVWKSPAGSEATLRGVLRAEVAFTTREIELLNAAGINALRATPEGGPMIWGIRTLRSGEEAGDEYCYLPVRRTALHVEESIRRGLQWCVYEENAEPLWARARTAVEGYLNDLWRAGAFQGSRPGHAYYVQCGRDTTTPADVERGVCIVRAGFAPLRPAEFISLRVEVMCGQVRREPPPLR
jgi:phage tail sheath protein FI